jgi:hypothetical protein
MWIGVHKSYHHLFPSASWTVKQTFTSPLRSWATYLGCFVVLYHVKARESIATWLLSGQPMYRSIPGKPMKFFCSAKSPYWWLYDPRCVPGAWSPRVKRSGVWSWTHLHLKPKIGKRDSTSTSAYATKAYAVGTSHFPFKDGIVCVPWWHFREWRCSSTNY